MQPPPTTHRSRHDLRRRAAAALAVVSFLAAFALALAAPASAAIFDAGPVTFSLTGGTINLNTGNTAGVTPFAVDLAGGGTPATFTGTLAADGTLAIPANGVSFPPTTFTQSGLSVAVQVSAATAMNGTIDPTTGDASASVTLAVTLTLPSPPLPAGQVCTISVAMDLSSAEAGGAPFDGSVVKLADSGFTVPATTPAAPSATLCSVVDGPAGLPAPQAGGTNSAILTLTKVTQQPTTTTTGATTTSSATTATTAPATTSSATTATTVAATTTTQSQVQSLAAGSISPTYTCAGADDATRGLLGALGGAGVSLAPQLSVAAVSPSPAQGASFSPSFSLRVDLPADLVSQVVALGITQAQISNLKLTISPKDGVSGQPLVAQPGNQTLTLAAGQAARMNLGPFSAAFTRTSAIGQPVSWQAGDITMTLSVSMAGSPISLNLTCPATGQTVLSVVDRAGSGGGTEVLGNQTARNGQATASSGSGQLASTGSRNLELALLAGVLLGFGVAATNEAAVRRPGREHR